MTLYQQTDLMTVVEPGHAGAGHLHQAAAVLEEIGAALGRDLERARAGVARLAQLLAADRAEPARGGLAPWQLRKVERHVAEHLDGPICVDELAGLVSLSTSHFSRAFRASVGQAPHAYVMRKRLEKAQGLMLNTDEPLSQIALACGLCDQAHFTRLFRRGAGQSPAAWRRLNLVRA